MNSSSISRMLVVTVIALMSLALTGCGSGLSGTYTSKDEGAMIVKLTFTSGNKVEVGLQLSAMAGTYVIEGKTLKVTLTSGNMFTFTIDAKGCLVGGDETLGSTLCKQ